MLPGDLQYLETHYEPLGPLTFACAAPEAYSDFLVGSLRPTSGFSLQPRPPMLPALSVLTTHIQEQELRACELWSWDREKEALTGPGLHPPEQV